MTHEELDAVAREAEELRVERLKSSLDKLSLKDVSLEERRREARKPLYLVRYE